MKNNKKLVKGASLGMAIGAILGILTDNIGLWISVGLAIGAGVGNSLNKKEKTESE